MAEKSVMDLDDASWEAVVEKGDKPVVVMFYDQLCPHCMIMMPHFEKYAADFKDKILFARIDVTRNPLAVIGMVSWQLRPSSSFAGDVRFRRSWVRSTRLC
jgi:thiol-disulfide isomerase/thioredoxin